MNMVTRTEAVRFIFKVRQLIDNNVMIQNHIFVVLSDEMNLRNKIEVDAACYDISNDELSKILLCITGNKYKVFGEDVNMFYCSCCGKRTLTEKYDSKEGTGYDICPYCGWEDDGTLSDTQYSSVNKGTILDYRKKMIKM